LIPVSVMVTGRGTVSTKIKGNYGKGKPSRFTELYKPVVFWNITYKCNLKCVHCYIDATPFEKPGELSLNELQDIAYKMHRHGIPLVILTGGEPLASPKFWPLVQTLRKLEKPRWSLSTNGTLIDRDTAHRLKDMGSSYVGVSLDSVDPLIHDKFRGVRGSFESALRGIRNAISAGLDTGIRMTLTRSSIGKAREILELARDLGVHRVSLYLLDSSGRASYLKEELPTPSQVASLADELIESSRDSWGDPEVLVVRGNFVGIYIADKLSKSRRDFLEYLSMIGAQGDCGRKTISVYPDGNVKPCQFLEYTNIGNLRIDPINKILSPDNDRLKPFTMTHIHLKGKKCSRCPFKAVCGGGSRNRALAYTGDFWGDDPLCPIEPVKIAERWGVTEGDVLEAINMVG